MQGEKVSFQVILPTQRPLPNLVTQSTAPQAQFLVGYRNVLSFKGEELSWGLLKSKNHCGRAFTFPIDESKAVAIQQFKSDNEVIQTVGSNFIFLKVEKDISRPSTKITAETLRNLLEQLGEVSKITLNILKCSFDSYDDYRKVVDLETQNSLQLQNSTKELEEREKIKTELKSKILSGKGLLLLPLIDKETGKCNEQKSLELKLLQQ